MKCPNCVHSQLVPVMTKEGVEIDFCPQCEGIWLDRDEIYHFTHTPSYLKTSIEEAKKSQKPSSKLSPVSGRPMVELSIAGDTIKIDYCPESEGIWLDKDEINRLPAIKSRIQIDKGTFEKKEIPLPKTLLALPNLSFRSGMVLFGMYALLTLFLIILVELTEISALAALIIGLLCASIHFLFGPFLMDLSLRFLYRIKWVSPTALPAHLHQFMSKVSQSKNIKFPRVGIIFDGAPNAFTYGHHPRTIRPFR